MSETVTERAESLLGYWEIHGDSPEVVAKWAVSDLLSLLRSIVASEV